LKTYLSKCRINNSLGVYTYNFLTYIDEMLKNYCNKDISNDPFFPILSLSTQSFGHLMCLLNTYKKLIG